MVRSASPAAVRNSLYCCRVLFGRPTNTPNWVVSIRSGRNSAMMLVAPRRRDALKSEAVSDDLRQPRGGDWRLAGDHVLDLHGHGGPAARIQVDLIEQLALPGCVSMRGNEQTAGSVPPGVAVLVGRTLVSAPFGLATAAMRANPTRACAVDPPIDAGVTVAITVACSRRRLALLMPCRWS